MLKHSPNAGVYVFYEHQRYLDLKWQGLFLVIARTNPLSPHKETSSNFPIPQLEPELNTALKQNTGC